MEKPLVSIVMPTYNASPVVENCLGSLLKTTYPNFELIVVDDCSKDDTLEKVMRILKKSKSRNFKRYKIYRNKQNEGAAFTRNKCYQKATQELIAFIETDMEFEPDWLTELVDHLISKEGLAAVASKSLRLEKKDRISCVGIKFNPVTFGVVGVGFNKPATKEFKSQEIGLGSVGTLFRKSAIKKAGGFDITFGHNLDDIDLSWRLWLIGYRQESVPDSVTYHWTKKPMKKRVTRGLKSEIISQKTLRVFLKNYEVKNIILYTPLLYGYQMLRSVWNLRNLNFVPLIGMFAGVVWNIFYLKDTLKERKRIQKLRKLTDKQIAEKIGYRGNYLKFVINDVT